MPFTRRDMLLLGAHAGLATLLPPLPANTQNRPNPFLEGGFAPVLDELDVDNLAVRGEVPKQIAGTYLRNGPNPAYPPISYTYPFDGDGMIHGLTFADGRVSYRNRFVMTAGLRADRRAGRTIYGGLMRPIKPDERFVPPDGDPSPFKNIANTSVIRHHGRILALYEGDRPYELDADLTTKSLYDFGGKVRDAVTAHPKVDPATGEMLMFRYRPMPPYLIFRVIDATGAVVREVPIDTGGVSYMAHDFVVTATYAVFFLCPVIFDLEGARQGRPFLSWQPQRGTRIAVVRRDGTGPVQWLQDDAFFVFHFMNAYEADSGITVDYVQHGALLASGAPPTLWRASLDLAKGTVSRTQLDQRLGEFPRIDPARSGLRHRYGWLPVKTPHDGIGVFGAIARYDFQSRDIAVHDFGSGREVGEPQFVPRPGASGESEGWIIAYVYDRATDGSVLAILDAVDIARPPIAEIVMPRRVPHGLHGTWLPA